MANPERFCPWTRASSESSSQAPELRQQLALVPRLSVVAAEAMLRLRPFADKADLRRRVNSAVGTPHEFVGAKLVERFDFAPADNGEQPPPRTRNADYGRELLALHITVLWSAWDGYDDGSGCELGMVWDYNADARRFTVRFPPRAWRREWTRCSLISTIVWDSSVRAIRCAKLPILDAVQ